MTLLGDAGSAVQIGKTSWSLLEYLKSVVNADILSGYFRYDGSRIEGSSAIEVERHDQAGKPAVWWYSVKPREDYVFIREPVQPGCVIEIIARVEGELQADARYWRWVAPVLPGRLFNDDAPNVRVDFMVFGYRPRALLRHFGEK